MTEASRHRLRRAGRVATLDERTCAMICPVSAGLVGVCLTAISIIQVAIQPHHGRTIADDMLAVDALLFLAAMLSSYFALRMQERTRLHWLERIADATFITAMVVLTIASFVLTYRMQA